MSRASHHYLAENVVDHGHDHGHRGKDFPNHVDLGYPVSNKQKSPGSAGCVWQRWYCTLHSFCSDPQVPTKPEKKYVVKSLVVAQSHSNLTVKFANDSGNFCCRLSIAGMTPAFSSERSSRFGSKISWCRNKTFKANMLRRNKCVL